MKSYKSKVQIGNVTKTVVAVNYTGQEKATEVTVDRLHNIHVLDRSWSMSSDLPALVENVKATFDMMGDNDLLSVIWFSGEGEGDILIKGATKSDDIKTLVDTLKTPVGVTCFSEPLANVNTIISSLSVLCSNFNVTFFTDGHTVTSHSTEEEGRRIFVQIDLMKDHIMALNTIGYGHWYNKELLQKMSDATMFGRMIHSSQINDYSDIWSHTYEQVSNMVVEKVKIETGAEILYLNSKSTKLSKDKVELGFLDKRKNQFFFILDEDTQSIQVNDEFINVSDITKKIPSTTLKNFYYALAYEYYYAGRTEEALDILALNVKDKYAVDTHLKAFTADERQAYQKELTKFIFKNKTRLKEGEAPEGYIPADDAFCVMDLLKLLAKGDNYYVPVQNYSRVGLKVSDNFNLFVQAEEDVKAPFKDFVFNAKHLNMSIKYMINGTVKINPIQAKQVNLSPEVDSRIYRNQTIIKDGNLNVSEFEAFLDLETWKQLMEIQEEMDVEFIEYISINEEGYTYAKFNLSVLPVINRQYSKKSDGIDSVEEVVVGIERLKAAQKVLKYYLDRCKVVNPVEKKFEKLSLTSEQADVLKQHGLNSKFDYQGIDNQSAEKNENDFYESRLLEMKVKGWSSLPKVEDVLSGKAKNAPAQEMAQIIEQVKANGWDVPTEASKTELEAVVKETKDRLVEYNVELNTLKMAKVLTGGWWTDLEVNNKGDYTYNNLVIKNGYVKKYF